MAAVARVKQNVNCFLDVITIFRIYTEHPATHRTPTVGIAIFGFVVDVLLLLLESPNMSIVSLISSRQTATTRVPFRHVHGTTEIARFRVVSMSLILFTCVVL